MFRAGLVEEFGRNASKSLGNSIVRAVKASGQFCNILYYDEMVLKCLIYLYNKQIESLEQF